MDSKSRLQIEVHAKGHVNDDQAVDACELKAANDSLFHQPRQSCCVAVLVVQCAYFQVRLIQLSFWSSIPGLTELKLYAAK